MVTALFSSPLGPTLLAFLDAPCIQSYSPRAQDGLMRPLITHSSNDKISSPRAHLPPPSGALSCSVFYSTSPWSSPPIAGDHFSSSELPPPTSRAARGPGLWAGVSPFLELLEGSKHTGLLCSHVPNAEHSSWHTAEGP